MSAFRFVLGILARNDKGEIISVRSEYDPSQEVKNFTLAAQEDYQVGEEILHRPFQEFNDMSLIDRMNVDQKAFNSYVQPKSTDPDEEWRWNGIRPLTRNKIISTAAHLTAAMMYPGIFAQNDQDEEDKDAAYVMRDLVEWNIHNSDYELSFLYGVIAALVNPVAYLEIDYAEIFQTIKKLKADGEVITQEIIDDVLSGFQIHNVPADEILIANAYEYHIQRQRFLIRRRFIDFDEAKAKYGTKDNFVYVRSGVRVFYNQGEAAFYEQYDENNPTLCEEVIYYNRREDTEAPFVNGIYMGNANVKANPIKHRDNKNRPKYPYVKYGAEPIDEKRFYFYKSFAAKFANDQVIADEMWRMVMDATFHAGRPGVAIIGGELNTDIAFPGTVTNFEKDTQIQEVAPGVQNINAIWTAIKEIEQSISESTLGEPRAGTGEDIGKTAYEVSKIEQNARINLGLVGRMITKMVKDVGELLVDDILRYQTIGEFQEIVGGQIKLKYRSFLLSDQTNEGKKVTDRIIFDGSLINSRMSAEDMKNRKFELLEKEGGIDSDTRLYLVNPLKFSKIKYLVTIGPEEWMPKNERFETLAKLEVYDRGIKNMVVDQEALTRDFLFEPLLKGDADKYIRKDKEDMLQQLLAGQMPGGNKPGMLPLGSPIQKMGSEAAMRE